MTGDWRVDVIVRAPSGNTDAEHTIAHGLDETEAYDLYDVHTRTGRWVDREAIDPARWLDAWLEEPGHYDRLDEQEKAIWVADFWRTFAAASGDTDAP